MAKKSFFRKALDMAVDKMGYLSYKKEEVGGYNSIALNTTTLNQQEIQKKGLKKPGNVSFKILRALSRQDAIIRICINVIKKAVSQSEWFIEVDKEHINDPGVKEAEKKAYDLFEFTNMNEENARVLLDRTIDDLLILDAGVTENIRTLDGKEIIGLNSVDGATIRPVYNEYGELGDPAYKQVIGDKVVAEFSKEDMVYMMMNPQNDINYFGYGLSPIESILLQVQASLEADMYNIKSFTQSTVPPGMLDLGDMSEDEAKKFISVWRSTVQSNPHALKFVYGGSANKRFVPFNTSNKDMQYAEYLDWLTRIKLAAFGLSGLEANITQDVNRATAEVQYQISQSRGVQSVKRLIEEYFTRGIIWRIELENEAFRYLKFRFKPSDSMTEKETQARIDKIYIETGIKDPNEIREREGLAPKEELSYTEELDSAIRESLGEEELEEGQDN